MYFRTDIFDLGSLYLSFTSMLIIYYTSRIMDPFNKVLSQDPELQNQCMFRYWNLWSWSHSISSGHHSNRCGDCISLNCVCRAVIILLFLWNRDLVIVYIHFLVCNHWFVSIVISSIHFVLNAFRFLFLLASSSRDCFQSFKTYTYLYTLCWKSSFHTSPQLYLWVRNFDLLVHNRSLVLEQLDWDVSCDRFPTIYSYTERKDCVIDPYPFVLLRHLLGLLFLFLLWRQCHALCSYQESKQSPCHIFGCVWTGWLGNEAIGPSHQVVILEWSFVGSRRYLLARHGHLSSETLWSV